KKIWIVDTPYPARSGKVTELTQQGQATFAVYDHHPETPDGLKGEQMVIQPTGACTSILVELIKKHSLPLTSLEATLLVLGIYEDTGSLTFPTTTARDLEAAAFLVEHGAKLSSVPNCVNIQLSNEQRDVLKKMVNSLTVMEINGVLVHFSMVKVKKYVDGASFLVHKLMDLEEIEVLFSLFDMEDKVYIIARSRLDEIDVATITKELKGGGHKSAASAAVKGATLEEVRKKIIAILDRSFSFTRAGDIMSYPVKTISKEATINDAFMVLMRSGFSGLPVVNEKEILVGVIARRDMEKAIHHGLQNAPVKSFMSPQIIGVAYRDSIFTVRNLMVENDIGRIPVVKDGRPIGIITRSDLLRVFHQRENSVIHELTRMNFSEQIFLHFSRPDLDILNLISSLASRRGVRAFLVGGVVRDIILGVPNHDLDLVIEGDAIAFAAGVQALLGGKVVSYPPFGTAVFFLKEGKRIDFASARREFYRSPGAAPEVESSNLKRDLFRRDFTVNAMAISVYPDNWGELFDFFGGFRDLHQKVLRILHPLSFVDDPGRSIRAVRFEQKYGFRIEPFTLSLLKQTIRNGFLEKLKPARIKEEIGFILLLPEYHRYLERLYQLDMFPVLFPGCIWKSEYTEIFIRLERLIPEVEKRFPVDWFLLRISPFFDDFEPGLGVDLPQRISLPHSFQQKVMSYHQKKEELVHQMGLKELLPSEVFCLFRSIPLEFIVLNQAKLAEQELATTRLRQYLDEWISVRTELTGNDLRTLGIEEGPGYATILEELKLARIDGLVHNRTEEIEQVLQIRERMVTDEYQSKRKNFQRHETHR
ncbi:MAG: CBS domain-containing protein, partial [Atribacterota bacterium]